jgi:hypothetical protein
MSFMVSVPCAQAGANRAHSKKLAERASRLGHQKP